MCLQRTTESRGDELLRPGVASRGAAAGFALLLALLAALWCRHAARACRTRRAAGRDRRDEERGASDAHDFVPQRLLWWSMGNYRADLRSAAREWRAEQASEALGLKMYQQLPEAAGDGAHRNATAGVGGRGARRSVGGVCKSCGADVGGGVGHNGGGGGGGGNVLVQCPHYHECGLWYEMPAALVAEEAQSTQLYSETLAMNDLHAAASISPPTSIALAYRNLSLTVGGKQILKPMQGIIRPGRLTAVLGASGSGKSSFIAALTGRAHAYGAVRGEIYIQGGKKGHAGVWQQGDLRLINDYVGFVPQEDTMMRDLTVFENVAFAAKWRAEHGSNISECVADVLKDLELLHVANSVIGDEERRGISGGERKRVNIALELVHSPAVLLLDEPTSGLDAGASIKCMRLLKRFAAQRNAAVLAVIHQPRREIFDMLDDVLLLAKGGRIAYHGPRSGMLPYFASHFEALPRIGQNPADFVLDVLTDSEHLALKQFTVEWQSHPSNRTSASLEGSVERFDAPLCRRRANCLLQFVYCAQRAILQLSNGARGEVAFACALAVSAFGIGAVFRTVKIYQLPTCIFFLGLILSLVTAVRALRVFGAERAVFWREAASGLNRVSYGLSKLTVDLIPTLLFPLCTLLGFTCFGSPLGDFGRYYLLLLVVAYELSGLGYCLSIVLNKHRSQLVAVLIVAIFNVFSSVQPTRLTLEEMTKPGFVKIAFAIGYAPSLVKGAFAVEVDGYKVVYEAAGCIQDEQLEMKDVQDAVAVSERYTWEDVLTPRHSQRFGWEEALVGSFVKGTVYRALLLLLLIATHRGSQNHTGYFIGGLFGCFRSQRGAISSVGGAYRRSKSPNSRREAGSNRNNSSRRHRRKASRPSVQSSVRRAGMNAAQQQEQPPNPLQPSMWGANWNAPLAAQLAAAAPDISAASAAATAATTFSDPLASYPWYRAGDRGTVEAELRARNQPNVALVRPRRGGKCTHTVSSLNNAGKIVHLLVFCDPQNSVFYGVGTGGAVKDQSKTLSELCAKLNISLAMSWALCN